MDHSCAEKLDGRRKMESAEPSSSRECALKSNAFLTGNPTAIVAPCPAESA